MGGTNNGRLSKPMGENTARNYGYSVWNGMSDADVPYSAWGTRAMPSGSYIPRGPSGTSHTTGFYGGQEYPNNMGYGIGEDLDGFCARPQQRHPALAQWRRSRRPKPSRQPFPIRRPPSQPRRVRSFSISRLQWRPIPATQTPAPKGLGLSRLASREDICIILLAFFVVLRSPRPFD